jgi:hypothetical protein
MDRRIFSQPILMEKQASSNTKINNKHLVSIICSLIGEQLNIAVRSKRSTYKRTTVDEFHILNVQKAKEKKKRHVIPSALSRDYFFCSRSCCWTCFSKGSLWGLGNLRVVWIPGFNFTLSSFTQASEVLTSTKTSHKSCTISGLTPFGFPAHQNPVTDGPCHLRIAGVG